MAALFTLRLPPKSKRNFRTPQINADAHVTPFPETLAEPRTPFIKPLRERVRSLAQEQTPAPYERA